jgi:hypothetical protein
MVSYKSAPVIPQANVVYEGGYSGDTDTSHNFWSDADGMRFVAGRPQTQGATVAVTLTTTDPNSLADLEGAGDSFLLGKPFRYVDGSGNVYYVVGSLTKLYALKVSSENSDASRYFELFNVTPLSGSTTAIANSLATQFLTLGSNPLATTSGSP